MNFYLAEVPPIDAPAWVVESISALQSACDIELHGEDNSESTPALTAMYANQTDTDKYFLVALADSALVGTVRAPKSSTRTGLPEVPVEGGEVLGCAYLAFPRKDNPHLAEDGWITVDSAHRRRGIGQALWEHLLALTRTQGRTSIIGYTDHARAAEQGDPDALQPPTGTAALPLDAASSFALRCGFSLEQTEQQSSLLMPVPEDVLVGLWESAVPLAHSYTLRSYVGPTPADLLEGVGPMFAALSSDAPTAGLDWHGESWDAERVARHDAVIAASGVMYTTVALHRGTKEVVALTQIMCDHERPDRAFQWSTIVASAHRGHRLGILIKVANLRLLAEEEPRATSVQTWNAAENDHMLAINVALGFRASSLGGVWQLTLSPGSG
ncbi:MAG: GNAT family N-acetyltransferase [Micropruina sp.]